MSTNALVGAPCKKNSSVGFLHTKTKNEKEVKANFARFKSFVFYSLEAVGFIKDLCE